MTSVIDDMKICHPIAIDSRSQATLEMAKKAAITNATILITGETGVGKELLALFVHRHSLFSQGPFISVNCAALPENMIEAILFGYEKGAFTNAINSYEGKFEQANNGTLLLDEIAELPLMLQSKLLRVLQERVVERLGGKKGIKLNVRIIAATNRNLKEQVSLGEFRSDLYYRLNVIPIHCLALRERPLDIIPLVEYFIEKHCNALGSKIPQLTNAAKDKLKQYGWPGNIREMDNVIQRILILKPSSNLQAVDFDLSEEPNKKNDTNFNNTLEEIESRKIIDVLRESNGCRSITAKKLNISARTLRYKISKLKSIGLIIP